MIVFFSTYSSSKMKRPKICSLVIGSAERSAPTHSQRTNEWAPGWYQLFFADDVAASIAHFVCFEVGNLIETLSRLGLSATGWPWAGIAVLRMETVIYVASEVVTAMKPRASTNEDATPKPFRVVVAVGGAVVRRDIVVPVGTHRRNSDLDAHLSLCFGSSCHEADSSNSS